MLEKYIKLLKENGNKNAINEVQILLCHFLSCDKIDLITKSDKFIKKFNKIDEDEFLNIIKRRSKNEPISKIIGKKEFYGENFFTNQYTLDPRPDTETLIDAVLECINDKGKKLNILDLGVGTGCIIITLLNILKNSNGFGIDLSEKALSVFKKNINKFNLTSRCSVINGNWTESINESIKFDIIISNPPYINKNFEIDEQTKHDPEMALFSENTGLEHYEYFSKNLRNILQENGFLFLEIGYDQKKSVCEIFEKEKWKINKVYKDYGGNYRAIKLT